MTEEQTQRQTAVNVQEKAGLIWAIADNLVGEYKPFEYGNVILPMCVIKRFDDTLKGTKEAVIECNRRLGGIATELRDGFLCDAANQQFYNTSRFTFPKLLADPDNIHDNFLDYIAGFSENVRDIIACMEFERELTRLADSKLLYIVVQEFCTDKGNFSPERITSVDMGYIFEELIRKFSESYNEQAGAHFTARDIICLMAELLIGDDEQSLGSHGVVAGVYDMAMGTSQMLSVLTDRLRRTDPQAEVTSHGQELNRFTYGIAKADTLIRGGNAKNMALGDTLSDDKFPARRFDYIISNPPFGIKWEKERKEVEREHALGAAGRFEAGLPSISDGQMLFLLNGVAKLADDGRMAIIQNGSPLFNGEAGSGESDIRGFLLERDLVEAIVQLPSDLFYNTGIATYIWLIAKTKRPERQGRVQLINAAECYEKRRKSLGNKRVDITEPCINLIMQAYRNGGDSSYNDEQRHLRVETKTFPISYFRYTRLTVCRPLRLTYENLAMPDGAATLKETERSLLQTAIDAYREHADGKALSDDEFFDLLRLHGMKPSAQQTKLIRRHLAQRDPNAAPVRTRPGKSGKDGGYEYDPELTDTETVPDGADIDDYIERNVLPYAPDAVIDSSKTRIGYEIPFTREFYKYAAPQSSEDIFAKLKDLAAEENRLMNKIFGE